MILINKFVDCRSVLVKGDCFLAIPSLPNYVQKLLNSFMNSIRSPSFCKITELLLIIFIFIRTTF
jgi:hypothetical protein